MKMHKKINPLEANQMRDSKSWNRMMIPTGPDRQYLRPTQSVEPRAVTSLDVRSTLPVQQNIPCKRQKKYLVPIDTRFGSYRTKYSRPERALPQTTGIATARKQQSS